MGFYAPAQLLRNARENGVETLPVNVNHSEWDCTLEEREKGCEGYEGAAGSKGPALRLGFCMLYGLARKHAERVVEARVGRAFSSLEEFARRTGLGRPTLVRLAKAGALASLGMDRRAALWAALAEDRRELPLFAPRQETDHPNVPVPLPEMSPAEEVLADYRTAGLSLRGHPLEFLRAELQRSGRFRRRNCEIGPRESPFASPASSSSANALRPPRASPSSPWKTRREWRI